ncbi:MAG: DUF433 domain-containing protein [Ignavibacteriaceae bacterium]
MKRDFINIDKEILGGTPVFSGTRVPIQSLFDHLEKGISVDDFLEDFPSVSKEKVIQILQFAEEILTSEKYSFIYETAA